MVPPPFTHHHHHHQYYFGLISTLFGGSRRIGCYALALYIIAIGLYRDYSFHHALASQPHIIEFQSINVYYGGVALLAIGQLFVLTSFYRLGFIGTFLGDYFGFLMDAPVTGFPFNILSNPMYIGATMSFAGHALMQASASGLLYTVWVYAIYRAALELEEPFTHYIYAQREKKRTAGKK